jgi:hypothetical protein
VVLLSLTRLGKVEVEIEKRMIDNEIPIPLNSKSSLNGRIFPQNFGLVSIRFSLLVLSKRLQWIEYSLNSPLIGRKGGKRAKVCETSRPYSGCCVLNNLIYVRFNTLQVSFCNGMQDWHALPKE